MLLLERLLSFLLVISLLSSIALSLTACSGENPSDQSGTGGGEGTDTDTPSDDTNDGQEVIYIPSLKDYPDRNTVHYGEMSYKRPDFDGVIAEFNGVIEAIRESTVSYDEQLALLYGLYDGFSDVQTNYTLVLVMQNQNALDESVNEELSYVSGRYPSFMDVIEELYVACAQSAYAREFERDYFNADISEYEDGGKLSDEVVALLSEEAQKETTYNTLSSQQEFEFNGKTDTYDNFLIELQKKYASMLDSSQYMSQKLALDFAYEEQIVAPINELYVELIRIRRQIADALGYDTYLPYAYEENGYDYTPEDMQTFIDNICQYVAPIYWDSEFYGAYSLKMQTTENEKVSRVNLVNNLYTVYQLADEELGDIYRYMLQFGLFDIEKASAVRFDGAFTTYFASYDAPFLFATVNELSSDYLSIAHEFGHFTDAFINYNTTSSLDLCEVYSQGLELLTIPAMKRVLPSEVTVYLKYSALYSAIQTLMIQGFYSQFELLVYELDYDEITMDAISEIAQAVAEQFGFYQPESFSISTCTITHTVLYPTYVQSYCTSVIPALELYLAELACEDAGFAMYKKLLYSSEGHTYAEALSEAGLSGPFESGVVKQVIDEVYYEFLGKHFYCVDGDCNAA